MQQLVGIWSSLGWARRIWVIAATLAAFAILLAIARMANTPRMTLLYGGLDPAAAGEVVTALDREGVVYDVRGTSIFVDASRRDHLRMQLAGEGKPAGGAQGYELLDGLTGFGTTSRMFDATYWRAKEGELARTIMAHPDLVGARVHISNLARDPFSRRETASASVSVSTRSGAAVPPARASALRHLVASAVAGLDARQVSVIDARFGLVAEAGPEGVVAADRAETLRRNALRILEARVGAGRAIVEVSIDTVSEREVLSERRIDPEARVAISSDTEESSQKSSNTGNGAVTVASNLPDGATGANAQNAEQNDKTTREIVNYDVSETSREVVREPGGVKRLSVAVLVDGSLAADTEGQMVWSPRSAKELEDLRDLVATAVGIDETRGDSLTIKSLQFEPLPDVVETPMPGLMDRVSLDLTRILQIAVMAVVTLILGLFVVRPILAPRGAVAALAPPMPAGSSGDALNFDALPPMDDIDLPTMPQIDALSAPRESSSDSGNGPVDQLKRLIDAKPGESVEVLGQWMNDNREQVG